MRFVAGPLLRVVGVAATAFALAPVAGQARELERVTLLSRDAVPRTCSERLPSAQEGATVVSWTAPAAGILTARLDGDRFSDWDLAVYGAGNRALLGASGAFGAAERVVAWVATGQRVTIQACRRRGPAASVRLTLDLHPTTFTEPRQERSSLLGGSLGAADDRATEPWLAFVPLNGRDDLRRLEATGIDVTHDVSTAGAKVVIYSEADRLRLQQEGFLATTLVPALAALDRRQRFAEARAGIDSALPSGRTTYREYIDYQEELKALVERHPGHARKVTLPLPSFEGRPIEGVELAEDVRRDDDGRPAYVIVGLHHAREWPSGEMAMEFALDLARRFGTDARVTALLRRVRVFVIPVVNPDGFVVSRGAGSSAADRTARGMLSGALDPEAEYKRQNCRPTVPASASLPCAVRGRSGVDLNRNYGAYWGGVGTTLDPTSETYRGSAPYSEPESEAVHRFSSGKQITVFISNHTFTDDGKWLRQPGFDDVVRVTPDERAMKALGDAMAGSTGWSSELAYETLGEITGATEDWNYFAQGAYGFTPEIRAPNFHPSYEQAVVREYLGAGRVAGRGARDALLIAGERAGDRSEHAVIEGLAPPGALLRLRKTFSTPTSVPGVTVEDRIETTLTVPRSGRYTWDVNPSTRPLASAPEHWTLSLESAGGAVRGTREVVVGRGQRVTVNFP